MAIASLSIIVTAALSPFAQIQFAAQQQQNNVNNNNNTPKLSLSTVSSSYSNCTRGFKDKKAIKMLKHIFVKNP